MDAAANLLIGVLQTVSLLVIVALGLAVIFGLMGVINFAHGEFLMLGAFLTLTGVRAGLPLGLAMAGATLAMGAFGVIVRAATQNAPMARALGMDARRINMGTFALGAALAGAGGALLAPITAVTPSMGGAFIARAFMTVVVG